MPAKSTSFRISQEARRRLTVRAKHERVSATALLERLIVEGIDSLDHDGIVFRGPPHDRRAALAGGPDVWEVIGRLRELDGSEEHRITTLADESGLHARQIRIAVDFAAAHPDDVNARIANNQAAAAASYRAVEQRRALLA